MNLLFVCTGNTCRSPIAEVIGRAEARARGLAEVRCASAGTFAFPDQPASRAGVEVARARGLDLEGHRSRELTLELLEWADRVVGMESSHVAVARRLAPQGQADLMCDFLPDGDPFRGLGVPDPYGADREIYARTFELLERAVRGLFDALEARPDGT